MKPKDKDSNEAIETAVRVISVSAEHAVAVRELFEAIYGCGYCDGRLSMFEEIHPPKPVTS